jgi:hypothetical protein
MRMIDDLRGNEWSEDRCGRKFMHTILIGARHVFGYDHRVRPHATGRSWRSIYPVTKVKALGEMVSVVFRKPETFNRIISSLYNRTLLPPKSTQYCLSAVWV